MNSMRLLVMAVVVLALLFVFFSDFLRFFQPVQSTVEPIQNALTVAKLSQGKAIVISSPAYKTAGGLAKETFEDRGTQTVFECNSPFFCCDQDLACTDKTRWSQQRVTFGQNQTIPTFVRCHSQFDFFACRIFFGQKPSQLELANISYPKTVDLASEPNVSLSAHVQNTGTLQNLPGTATLKVQKKQSDSIELITLQTFSQAIEPLAAQTTTPRPVASQSLFFSIPLQTAGDYVLTLRVQSDNAGFDEREILIQVTGQTASSCEADTNRPPEKSFNTETSECATKYFCQNCRFGFECKNAWQTLEPETPFDIGDATFAQILELTVESECQ